MCKRYKKFFFSNVEGINFTNTGSIILGNIIVNNILTEFVQMKNRIVWKCVNENLSIKTNSI